MTSRMNKEELLLEMRAQAATLFALYGELLPQSQRQALHLYLVEDLSISEIASVLAMSRQGAHDSITKGINKLQAIAEKLAAND